MTPLEKQQLDQAIRDIRDLKQLNSRLIQLLDVFYRMNQVDKFYLDKPLVLRNAGIRLEGAGGSFGAASTDLLSFYGADPIQQPAAPTADLTHITYTAPGTPDYALQDLVNVSGYGFVTKDEGNTVLKVIENLQIRVKELEDILSSLGLSA